MKATRIEKLNKGLVALLLLGMIYLGLMLFLGTSSSFLIVRGTSMEPTLHAGDMLLNKHVAPTEIKVGDVIAFDIPSDVQQRLRMPPKATHRVIGIEAEDGQMVFVTQGDNSDVDPFKVPSSRVRGAVVKNLGPLGWPILLLANKALLLFLGIPILTFALIVLATLWLSPSEKSRAPASFSGRTASRRASSRATRDAGDLLPSHIGIPLDRLTSAVSSYGVHIQSHTSIIKRMAGSSTGLEEAVRHQNEILAELAAVVREMKYHRGQSDSQPEEPDPVSGHKKAGNGVRAKKANGHDKSHNGTAEHVAQAAKANGHDKSHNGTAEHVAQAANANGYNKSHNGIAEHVAQAAKANGHNKSHNGTSEHVVQTVNANGHNKSHNGDQPEKPILSRTKEERVKELVAEIEARIKANLD
jgi:signal peptidase